MASELEFPAGPRMLRRTTTGDLVRLISADIQRGNFRPGQRLTQRELGVQFGVSTTPVREALQVLAAQGLVEIDPHRGSMVAERSAAEIRESYEIRKALEGLAIAKAVPSITEEGIERAETILRAMAQAEDRAAWAELNDDFHFELYRWASMPHLIELIFRLRAIASYYVEGAHDVGCRRNEAMAEHSRIVAACAARDAAAARQAIEEHLDRSVPLAIEQLDAVHRGTVEMDAPSTDGMGPAKEQA